VAAALFFLLLAALLVGMVIGFYVLPNRPLQVVIPGGDPVAIERKLSESGALSSGGWDRYRSTTQDQIEIFTTGKNASATLAIAFAVNAENAIVVDVRLTRATRVIVGFFPIIKEAIPVLARKHRIKTVLQS
jgi:hypothetical protein